MSATVKDVLTRAAKTAIQCFGGLVTVDVFFQGDIGTVEKAAIAAAAAGVSVVWNAILVWASK